MMRIAIDAMGGDRAPAAPVSGALAALADHDDFELVLVGDEARLEGELDAAKAGDAERSRIRIHHAPEIAGASGDPVRDVRASDQVSARACAELVRAGEVSGVVTMGNTGAAVAAATLYCKRLTGVRRLGIAAPFPRPGGVTICLDAGANPDARPEDLHQYATMGRLYAKHALGIEQPRIGILSIGEEEHKGNRLVKEAWELFRASPIKGFVGNVEPREMFVDRADVVVTDGFVGNIALKAGEGMGEFVLGQLKSILVELHPETARQTLGAIAKRVDFEAYGGAPLLGSEGGCVIGHGRSGPVAFQNAVRVLRNYIQADVGGRIVKSLAEVGGTQGAPA